MRDFVKITVPNDTSYLSITKHCVRETAKKFGFPDDALYDIEVGVEEAATSVIDHSFEEGERGEYDIICTRIPLGMKIVFKDRGLPFDPNLIPDYTPGEPVDDPDYDCLRIFLLKKLMDRVSFHNLGQEGKETHLVKYLPAKLVEISGLRAEVCREEEPSGKPAVKKKVEYDVRALDPIEAIEVSRCAYKSHGLTFFDEHIYYPERIVELNRTGMMISAVAVTKDNVFMGHSALVLPYEGARIAELTFVFTNVEFRGQGAMNRLCGHLFDLAASREMVGLYAYAVTNHVFTQKVMVKYGFHDCGMLLATSPETWVFKGIPGDRTQRISVALSFKYLQEPPPLTLYPPAHHRGMVEKIYGNMEGAHLYAVPDDSAAELPGEPTVVETEIESTENCADVYLIRYGADTLNEVGRILRGLCVKNIAAVGLWLSLEDPRTYFFASEFEKMGFFFAGIIPASRIGDALLLQFLNNIELDYGKIQAYTDMAKEILFYVRERDPYNQ